MTASTSEYRAAARDDAYVWVWLPGQADPVVAGRIQRRGSRYRFGYGRSYGPGERFTQTLLISIPWTGEVSSPSPSPSDRVPRHP